MSLSKSFKILRRCLNTAASDSKTIRGWQSVSDTEFILKAQPQVGSQSVSDSKSNFNGHPEAGSHVNRGQAIQKSLADRALRIVAEFSIAGGIAATLFYWRYEAELKARLDDVKREVEQAGDIHCQAWKDWHRGAEALKTKEYQTKELRKISKVLNEIRAKKSHP